MDDIKVGDWVRCINNDNNTGYLTISKPYKILSINDIAGKYRIIADNGKQYDFFTLRFVKYVNKKNHLPVWF